MLAGGRLIGGGATPFAASVRSVTRPNVTQPTPCRLAETRGAAVDPTLYRQNVPVLRGTLATKSLREVTAGAAPELLILCGCEMGLPTTPYTTESSPVYPLVPGRTCTETVQVGPPDRHSAGPDAHPPGPAKPTDRRLRAMLDLHHDLEKIPPGKSRRDLARKGGARALGVAGGASGLRRRHQRLRHSAADPRGRPQDLPRPATGGPRTAADRPTPTSTCGGSTPALGSGRFFCPASCVPRDSR